MCFSKENSPVPEDFPYKLGIQALNNSVLNIVREVLASIGPILLPYSHFVLLSCMTRYADIYRTDTYRLQM